MSVIEFPEYLKRMMRKGTNKKTHLANEYQVTFMFLSCNQYKYLVYRSFQISPSQRAKRLVFHITSQRINSRIFIHVSDEEEL